MGSASSSGVDIILTNPILKDLENATDLTLGQVKSLHHEMLDRSSNSLYIDPTIFEELLEANIRSSSIIVDAFRYSTRSGEKLVSIKCVICAFIIYSCAPWVSKVRCKIYLVIYSLFENKQSQALGAEEMSKLVKTVIKSVYIMTGMKLPPVSLVRDITTKVFSRADSKKNMRVGIDE
jgi:hypothetical protein